MGKFPVFSVSVSIPLLESKFFPLMGKFPVFSVSVSIPLLESIKFHFERFEFIFKLAFCLAKSFIGHLKAVIFILKLDNLICSSLVVLISSLIEVSHLLQLDRQVIAGLVTKLQFRGQLLNDSLAVLKVLDKHAHL